MSNIDVLDLFCGIGADLGIEQLGLTAHGIDNEPHVAATRERLGMATTLADITTLDPRDWVGVEGLWASPPCTDFSRAGKGAGIDGETGRLVFEPLRWVEAIRPRWVAMEQVVEAAPAFRSMAASLEGMGYRCAVVELSAEEYGVSQARKRMYLLGHRDRAPRIPPSTHQPYRLGVPAERPANLFGLLPWVSMAEALGWPDGIVLDRRQTDAPTIDTWAAPCPTITGTAVGKGVWTFTPRHTLTTAQGCRLMGFPDPDRVAAALIPGSKRAQWQIIGNAVASPMARTIVEGLAS